MDTNKYAQMYISVIRLYYFRYNRHVLLVINQYEWELNITDSQKNAYFFVKSTFNGFSRLKNKLKIIGNKL